MNIAFLYNCTYIMGYMNLVIDASVIIAVIMNEQTKLALIAHTNGANLFAPFSVHWEIGNAFSAMFKRRRTTLPEAGQALRSYYKIPLRFIDVDLMQSLELADQLGIYAYDAYIIACARDQKCPLLTLDGGLLDAAKRAGIIALEVRT